MNNKLTVMFCGALLLYFHLACGGGDSNRPVRPRQGTIRERNNLAATLESNLRRQNPSQYTGLIVETSGEYSENIVFTHSIMDDKIVSGLMSDYRFADKLKEYGFQSAEFRTPDGSFSDERQIR